MIKWFPWNSLGTAQLNLFGSFTVLFCFFLFIQHFFFFGILCYNKFIFLKRVNVLFRKSSFSGLEAVEHNTAELDNY